MPDKLDLAEVVKMNDEKVIRKAKCINYVAFGITVAFVLAIIIASVAYHDKHTFSTSKWLDDPEGRTAIVDNLLEKYELVGMSEDDVLSLLGEPDNDYGYFNADNRYVYYMGAERGLFGIDSEWLILDFMDGVVSDSYITTD